MGAGQDLHSSHVTRSPRAKAPVEGSQGALGGVKSGLGCSGGHRTASTWRRGDGREGRGLPVSPGSALEPGLCLPMVEGQGGGEEEEELPAHRVDAQRAPRWGRASGARAAEQGPLAGSHAEVATRCTPVIFGEAHGRQFSALGVRSGAGATSESPAETAWFLRSVRKSGPEGSQGRGRGFCRFSSFLSSRKMRGVSVSLTCAHKLDLQELFSAMPFPFLLLYLRRQFIPTPGGRAHCPLWE